MLHFQLLFERLEKLDVVVNIWKCVFGRHEIDYLGSTNGSEHDILEFRHRSKVQEVQRSVRYDKRVSSNGLIIKAKYMVVISP